ncbi:MAG: FHA domain-containing protein [Deltaproteobacteria bacterium]|nr:FHA domain-containing protein [Deltaproteobacteria bacterium]
MGGPHVLRHLLPRLVPALDPALAAELGLGVLVGRLPPEDADGWSFRTASVDRVLLPPQADGSGLSGDSQVFGLCKAAGARTQLDVVTVGRSRSNDVMLNHALVSKLHARFRLGDTCTVEDAGSSNGMQVDGNIITPDVPTPVFDGNMVSFGGVVLTFFRRATLCALVMRLAPRLH